ncbi:TetR/AcrR family transcriptional regulator [Bacillus sp. SCS-151]|uniref:TetR/AcrR family transcriptional regulator n=1 Tax=Nanhaiella sioensis TaxID=3115293 RepID=UPI00397C1FE2
MTRGFNKEFEHSDALMQAALNEFVEKGYDKASLNHILKTANMSKGSFYYHFNNKEDLYLNLIDMLIQKKQLFLAKVMNPSDYSKDIFSIFKTQIRIGMQFSNEYPDINRFANSFIKEKGTPIYEKALTRHNFQDNDQMNKLIEASYNKGEIRQTLPLEFVQSLIGFLFTNIVDVADMSKPDHYESSLNHLIDFLKNGLTDQ